MKKNPGRKERRKTQQFEPYHSNLLRGMIDVSKGRTLIPGAVEEAKRRIAQRVATLGRKRNLTPKERRELRRILS